jgi:hypothetical protein
VIDTSGVNLTPDEQRVSDEIAARISPPGALGLPPLLDQRRIEHSLVDEIFDLQAVFDRVFVYQLDPEWAQQDTFTKGGKIIKTQNTKERERKEAPFGILISAGQAARDVLHSNGMELGHIVGFIRLSPWAMPVAMVNNKQVPIMMLRVADLLGSYDLTKSLRADKGVIVLDPGSQQHLYVDDHGTRIPRDTANMGED